MVAELQAAIEMRGLLLVHDRELPSATKLLAGEPVSGSWWSHPQANAIYNALQALDEDVRSLKLVRGKVTLIHRRLWPSVLGIALGGESWQTAKLRSDARFLLDQVRVQGELRSDGIDLPDGSRKLGTVVTDLEKRLLVRSVQIHTDTGKHVRVLHSWEVAWPDVEPISAVDGRFKLEALTAGWRPGKLFPWE